MPYGCTGHAAGTHRVHAIAQKAIRGTHQDFTDGSISRAVFLLATPMVLEMLMESLFAITDVFWVTRLGSDAVATVGLTESILTMVYSVAIGVGMSTTAMVARRTGEKDMSGAATAAAQAILLGLGLAIAMGVPGVLLAPHMLGWMGATPMVIATGTSFTAVSMASTYAIMLIFLNNAIFRGAGDAAIAMRVLWMSNLINIVLDPLLIFGWGPFPEMGITGAAVATLIGRTVGVLYQFRVLMSGRGRVVLLWSDFRVVPPVLFSLVRVSLTGVMQFAIAHTSWIALVRMISAFGSGAVAGYTIGIRIFVFVVLPSWGSVELLRRWWDRISARKSRSVRFRPCTRRRLTTHCSWQPSRCCLSLSLACWSDSLRPIRSVAICD